MRTLAVTKVKTWPDAIITFALVSSQIFVVVTERSVELISDNGTAIDSATVAFNSLPLVVGSDLYFAHSADVTVVTHINVFNMRSPDTFPPIGSSGDVAAMVLSGSTLIVTLAANSTGATITAFDVAKKAMAFETVRTNILKLGAHAVSNNCYFQLDALGRVWRFNLTNGKVDTMQIPTGEGEITLMKPASKYLYITYDSAMWVVCPFHLVVLAKYPCRGPILNLLFSPKARVPSTLAVGSVILGTHRGYIVSTLSHEFVKVPVNIDFADSKFISTNVVQSAGKLCFGFGEEKSGLHQRNQWGRPLVG